MSCSRLIRAFLAAVPLCAALPLLGQVTASAAAASFPLGRYQLAVDSEHPERSAPVVVFTSATATIMDGDHVVKTRGVAAHGETIDIFDLTGACTTPASYRWRLEGQTLTLALLNDPCGDPAHAGRSMVLTRVPDPSATFPFGRYVLQALDSTHAPPPGLVIEFSTTAVKVMNGDQIMETHGMLVIGPKWEIFELQGDCLEPGDYLWHAVGNTISMELISDPCTERAQSITSVRFVRQ